MENVDLRDKLDDLTYYVASSKWLMAEEINHLSEELKVYRQALMVEKVLVTRLQYQLDHKNKKK